MSSPTPANQPIPTGETSPELIPVRHRNPYLFFLVANAIALVIGGGIFWFFLEADFLDGAMRWFGDFLFEHKGLAVIAAVSPLLAGLLVGMGYARRARARRRAAASGG